MESNLRSDELFVIEALCRTYDGTWRAGEDPPDAYMMLNEAEVAIEISILSQLVNNEAGELIPRLSQDSGACRMCDEINEELNQVIPPGMCVILTLTAPIKKLRKLKMALIERIISATRLGGPSDDLYEIFGNNVEIQIVLDDKFGNKKVRGIVQNINSDRHILSNAELTLSNRIIEKAKKCSKIVHRPLWLALFRDYWLAEPDTFQMAMENIKIEHPFNKVCLVLGDSRVLTLFER